MSRATNIIQLFEAIAIHHIPMKIRDDVGEIVFTYKEKIGDGIFTFNLEYDERRKFLHAAFRKDGSFFRDPHIMPSQQGAREMLRAGSVMISMIRQVVSKYDVEEVQFSADADDPSRVRLYKKYADELTRVLGGRLSIRPPTQYTDATFSILLGRKRDNPNFASGLTREFVLPPRAGERGGLQAMHPDMAKKTISDFSNAIINHLRRQGINNPRLGIEFTPRGHIKIDISGATRFLIGSSLQTAITTMIFQSARASKFGELRLQGVANIIDEGGGRFSFSVTCSTDNRALIQSLPNNYTVRK